MRGSRAHMRRGGSILLAAVLGGALVACSGDDAAGPTATEVIYVTGSQSVSASASVPSSAGKAPSKAKLAARFTTLSATLGQPVGVSIAPVGGGDALSFGDQVPQVAWSTIKVPLALAAQRKNGVLPAEAPAIVDSDNGSAEALWASLGTAEQAAQAVTAVLREGGDQTTIVPSVKSRPEFTVFGQTVWALDDAATFTAQLPCLPDSGEVVGLMGRVSANQSWGIEVIPNRTTAVKGGWGPSPDGGYVVRQIGIVTRKDGKQTAVALSTYAPGASMGSGIAALNQVGEWIGANMAALPGGRC